LQLWQDIKLEKQWNLFAELHQVLKHGEALVMSDFCSEFQELQGEQAVKHRTVRHEFKQEWHTYWLPHSNEQNN
jgi:hypothetical protein